MVHVEIVHKYFKKLKFSMKARRGMQRQNCFRQNYEQANTLRSPTPRSVSLGRVGLRTLLVTFGSLENLIVDSAKC